ncbi:DNA polymerase IV [Vibrio quintilis]|uniref:DNA polymerase IV n=1 Tax=Vibrio quintilis TaxID=1117707 RepID=A0A1M7Z0L6_9VIBR|nr:DNA polymerase IV [Vibrio quintilis]SHO58477.1 DNA polymerase IV [Vibrio quintilis]
MSRPIRKIIHIDMDCFFAAVEMRDFPQYTGMPLAVGGSQKQRGVISTCNYEARRFGVRSAMPTAQAFKLCPNLTLVPGRMQVYRDVSRQIHAIFQRYTGLIEPLSLDEAYLDVSSATQCQGSATLIAESIRADISRELNLTASAGVAPVKFLAKVASDINKPDGLYVITPDRMQQVINDLPLEKIPGVGRVSLNRLNRAGLYCCADVRAMDYRQLLLDFGRLGASLWKKSHGIDEREVMPERERKSVGVERTLSVNIKTYRECWDLIESQLYPELKKRYQALDGQREIIKQGIKIKFADFQQTTIEHIHQELSLKDFEGLLQRIIERQQGREIRLVGLHLMLRPEDESGQLSLSI